jgi:hypothetical protein
MNSMASNRCGRSITEPVSNDVAGAKAFVIGYGSGESLRESCRATEENVSRGGVKSNGTLEGLFL